MAKFPADAPKQKWLRALERNPGPKLSDSQNPTVS